jgi:hypothetical protein
MSTASQTAQILRQKAARCRRLAEAVTDRAVSRRLLELAIEYEEQAVLKDAPSEV